MTSATVTATRDILNAVVQGVVPRTYWIKPPDSVEPPWALLRWLPLESSGAEHGEREEGDLEILLYARAPRHLDDLDTLTEGLRQAFLQWRHRDGAGGLLFSKRQSWADLPPFSEPADRELVGVRGIVRVVLWPRYLTSVLTP